MAYQFAGLSLLCLATILSLIGGVILLMTILIGGGLLTFSTLGTGILSFSNLNNFTLSIWIILSLINRYFFLKRKNYYLVLLSQGVNTALWSVLMARLTEINAGYFIAPFLCLTTFSTCLMIILIL